jgi:berberine-like enzyme
MAFNVSRGNSDSPTNAVLPAWRSTLLQCIVGAPWNWFLPREDMVARKQKLMEEFIPALEALTPGSGSYLNEGNVEQQNWQQVFYGENYDRLLKIKNKYDPEGVFYAATAIGSEKWLLDGDGRLCKAESEESDNAVPIFERKL